jgi:membrane protein YqaA with SNARE-associated domain
MENWFKSIRYWSLYWANTKWGSWALFFCAFADASFLPLPTPLLFLTLALLNISRAYKYAMIGTAGILAGAMAGYSIGHFTWLDANEDFTGFAQFMFNNIPGFSKEAYTNISLQFAKWDFGILFVASFMPLPYNIFSVTSGVFDVNVFMFCIATLVGQGARFWLMAFGVIKLGPRVTKLIELKRKPAALILMACIVIAIVAITVFYKSTIL